MDCVHRVKPPARMQAARHAASRAAPLLAALALAGCSVFSIKSPEVPLTAREQEARLLTRDYASRFAATVTRSTDAAPAAADDPAVRSRALRLKLGAVTEITRTSTGLSPIGSLIDTWAFALQFRDFLAAGAGADLLGGGQPDIRDAAGTLAEDADRLARGVLGGDYPRYHAFVAGYVRHYPLQNLDFVRPSVLSEWVADGGDKTPLRSVGTVAQALGDVSDRMRIYGERVPIVSLWHAQLALDRAGFDDATYQNALHNIDAQLERISTLADTSPTLVHEAIADLRASLLESSQRLDASSMRILRTLHSAREALAANITAEREGIIAAFDTQRARMSADAQTLVANAVDTSWRELRKLVREALLLTTLLALVILGLPFTAGYLVGRRRKEPV